MGLIKFILDLAFWLSLVSFVVTGFYLLSHTTTALGTGKRSKQASRGYKFLGLAGLVAVLGMIFPVWLVALVGITGGTVAYNRVHKDKNPLNSSAYTQRLPR